MCKLLFKVGLVKRICYFDIWSVALIVMFRNGTITSHEVTCTPAKTPTHTHACTRTHMHCTYVR